MAESRRWEASAAAVATPTGEQYAASLATLSAALRRPSPPLSLSQGFWSSNQPKPQQHKPLDPSLRAVESRPFVPGPAKAERSRAPSLAPRVLQPDAQAGRHLRTPSKAAPGEGGAAFASDLPGAVQQACRATKAEVLFVSVSGLLASLIQHEKAGG